jgi:DNA-binding transcriptional MerR regulator
MLDGIKTGKVAKIFGVASKTIVAWVDRFPELFSPEANAENSKYRSFMSNDMFLLNTIQKERANGTSWDVIGLKLEADELNTDMPVESANIEGQTAIMLYVQISKLKAELENSEQERDRLVKEKRDDRLEYQETIANLNRQIGKLEAKLEMQSEAEDTDNK